MSKGPFVIVDANSGKCWNQTFPTRAEAVAHRNEMFTDNQHPPVPEYDVISPVMDYVEYLLKYGQ